MKKNKKYEMVIIATNKRRIGEMNKKVRVAKKVRSTKVQMRELMREVKRLNKMIAKMAKKCA